MMPSHDDLNAWMTAVATDSDREAFAALFRHFAPRVKSFLMRAGTPPALAEELAQETMVTLWRRAGSFDPARAAVSTWIFTIARNLRVDHHRRALARGAAGAAVAAAEGADWTDAPAPGAEAQAPPDADPFAATLATQRGRHVRAAMAQLPPEQLQVLSLAFFQQDSHTEIAAQLGLPLGTVKSRIRLAIEQLRARLEACR